MHSPDSRGTGLASVIALGGAWSTVGQVGAAVASMAATPFVVRMLGAEGYGLLSLINVILAYFVFCDLGMGAAASRFASLAHAKSEHALEASMMWTALAISSIPTLLSAALIVYYAHPILTIASVSEVTGLSPNRALMIASVAFAPRVLLPVLLAPTMARMRLDIYTMITGGANIAQIALCPVALYLGGGLIGVFAVSAFCNIVAFVIAIATVLRTVPQLSSSFLQPSLLRPLLGYGLAVALTSVLATLALNGEKLLIARYDSLANLAHYFLAFTLSRLLLVVPGAFAQALLPCFSALFARREIQELASLHTTALRWHYLWVLPACVCLCLLSRPALTILGGVRTAEVGAPVLYVLISGCAAEALSYVPRNALSAAGMPKLVVKCQGITLLLCAPIFFILTKAFGIYGAAIAWTLRVSLESILIFREAWVKLHLPFTIGADSSAGVKRVSWIVALLGVAAVAIGVFVHAIIAAGFVAIWLPIYARALFQEVGLRTKPLATGMNV